MFQQNKTYEPLSPQGQDIKTGVQQKKKNIVLKKALIKLWLHFLTSLQGSPLPSPGPLQEHNKNPLL